MPFPAQLKAISPTTSQNVETDLIHQNEKGESFDPVEVEYGTKVKQDNYWLKPDEGHNNSINGGDSSPKFHHNFLGVPLHHMQVPFIQPKLVVNTPGDMYEQEADAIAEKVMRMPDTSVANVQPVNTQQKVKRKCTTCRKEQEEDHEKEEDREEGNLQRMVMRKCAACEEEEKKKKKLVQRKEKGEHVPQVSPSVEHALQMPGQPLEPSTRVFMEQRFGVDFGKVRVHDDSPAHQSARNINALAYTHGNHIVFGEGQFQPDSYAGRSLLAHELVHVVQQAKVDSDISSIQRKKPKPDTRFYQQLIKRYKEKPEYQGPWYEDVMGSLIKLCEAVEKGDPSKIEEPFYIYYNKHLGFPYEVQGVDQEIYVELAYRMQKMGLFKYSTMIRNLFYVGSYYLESDLIKNQMNFFHELVKKAIVFEGIKTPENMKDAMVILVDIFTPLSKEMVKRGPEGSIKFGLDIDLVSLIEGFETIFQRLIRYTTENFAKGNLEGTKGLKIASEVLDNHLKPALDEVKGIEGMKFKITKTKLFENTGGKGVLMDWFSNGKEAKERELDVSTYDPDSEQVEESESSLENLYIVRKQQVEFLEKLYLGDSSKKDKPGNPEAIKRMGGKMRLHSDDDWRKFVIAKYKLLISGGATKEIAMVEIMRTLFEYFRAFTQPAQKVNIYDIGKTNYLNRKFPYSLSGKLLHDCGVYAVRVAYILSLIRLELGLRFRFVSLPVHIGMLIEGEGIPTFIVHNDHFRIIYEDEMIKKRSVWEKDSLMDPSTGAKLVEDDELKGTLVANDYISGVSMPYRFDDVPMPTKNGKSDSANLWKRYQSIAVKPIFGKSNMDPDSPNYLFENQYLKFNAEVRNIHNEFMLPYWNLNAPEVWNKYMECLRGKQTGDGNVNFAVALPCLERFKLEHNSISQDLLGAYKKLGEMKKEISRILSDDPGLSITTAPITSLTLTLSIADEEEINVFMKDVDEEIKFMEKHPKEKEKIEDILLALKPFFLPDKINPLD